MINLDTTLKLAKKDKVHVGFEGKLAFVSSEQTTYFEGRMIARLDWRKGFFNANNQVKFINHMNPLKIFVKYDFEYISGNTKNSCKNSSQQKKNIILTLKSQSWIVWYFLPLFLAFSNSINVSFYFDLNYYSYAYDWYSESYATISRFRMIAYACDPGWLHWNWTNCNWNSGPESYLFFGLP